MMSSYDQELTVNFEAHVDILNTYIDYVNGDEAAKSMAKFISQLCGELQLAVSLLREDLAI